MARKGRRQIRAWFDVIDAVLGAVEETAWAARGIADSVQGAFADDTRGDGERGVVPEWSGNVARVAQTGFVLARIAAGYRLHGFRSAFVSERRSEEILEELHADSARRFQEISATHGGAFMKVGQLLSARADLLPSVWIAELEKLQDAAPPLPFETVRRVVEDDFERTLEELFASFEATPVAAASIGQVHVATLLDGRRVAVKVQRPGIAAKVRLDLQLLEVFVDSLRASLPDTDYATILREVRENVLAEVDYVEEARKTAALAGHFANHAAIAVPLPVKELCSERVLTTHFVEGRKITAALADLEPRAAAGDAAARAAISETLGLLLEAYLRQVLEVGTFQADPHPGNLLVTPDGKIVVLDFGCAETLSPEVRDRYLALMGAFMTSDRARMAELFTALGFRTRSGRPDTLHLFADALLTDIGQAARGSIRWPTREEFGARMASLLAACEDDPVIVLPGEFIMIARVFGTLGGLFARYRPDIDFVRHVLPVLGPALF